MVLCPTVCYLAAPTYFTEIFAQEKPMAKNIVLIGFMGVGKGRTARQLASLTGRFGIDTDDLIESLTKTKIRKIFADKGEAAFRKLEQRTADWLAESVRDAIVSTGGGFFMVNNIKKLGHIVYLHAEVEEILTEILSHPNAKSKLKKRPLLADLKAAKKLYETRLPLYLKTAEVVIDVAGKDSRKIAREILKTLKVRIK
jgi:shikimate kinase